MIFLLFLALTGACQGYLSVEFPAVSENGGTLVTGNIWFKNGTGLYVNIFHSIGQDTQKSFLDAYKLSNQSCRVDVELSSDVVGGSGGLLAYIVLKYKTNNTIASGAIDYIGNVYPIGGLKEKIEAARDRGFKNFVTTITSPYQYYITTLFKDINITWINHVSELNYKNGYVYGHNNKSKIFVYPKVPKKPSKYNISFLKQDYEMLKKEILSYNIGLKEFDDYYGNLTKVTDKIASKGYYYSAANYLFLAAAEKVALYYLHNKKPSEELKSKVERCLNSFSINGNTEDDIASLVRVGWAKDVLQKKYGKLFDEKFSQYYEYEQAYLWCKLAQNIHKNKNLTYNNTYLEALQKRWLKEGYETKGEKYRLAIYHIDNVLVSLYNLAFVVPGNKELKNSYKSKWANVYASQAQYLKETKENYEKTAEVANNLEKVFGDERELKIGQFINVLVAIILVLVAGYVYLLLKGKKEIL